MRSSSREKGRSLSAALMAAAALPLPVMAMSPHPSCDLMLADMAEARDQALNLDNTDFYLVNWVVNMVAPGSRRGIILGGLREANWIVHMDGGGRGGYFSTSDFLDPNYSPAQIRGVYEAMYKGFQINIESGASCNLNDW